jgi:hypothetical protein
MATAGRSGPLRRTGSLLGLLGLELAAVLVLHWLGRFEGLRIRWDEPAPWLLSSPVQEILGAVLRTVGLVMAYWLLASTLLYLLASLSRLPSAVRAVRWATIPLVRRVADHAVAVTLATSMVGGGTLGMAGPAAAGQDRGGTGPPARKPVAAAQATSATAPQDAPSTSAEEATRPSAPVYVPDPADQAPATSADEAPATSAEEPTRASPPAYVPDPAGQAPRRLPATESTTPESTTETSAAGATAAPSTTAAPATEAPATAAPSTEAPSTEAQTTVPPTTAAPTSAAPQSTPDQARKGNAAGTTATTGLRPPAYEFTPATPTTNQRREEPSEGTEPGGDGDQEPGGGQEPGGPENPGGGGTDGEDRPGNGQEQRHRVARGDNLWAIARDHLATARGGGSGEPTNREVAAYWVRVVEANRDGLRSGDPDLIYPGEEITLPRVD